MAQYTKTYTFSNGTTADGGQVDTEITALGTSVNNITNAQIDPAAAIAISKTALGTFTPWTAYTPTISAGLTVGAGSVTGRYTQIGKFVRGKIYATLGAGFTASGATITWSLPVTATSSDASGFTTQVNGVWNHSSVAYPLVGSITFSSSTLTVGYFTPNGANPIYSTTLGNPGFTSGDTLFIDFTFEAA